MISSIIQGLTDAGTAVLNLLPTCPFYQAQQIIIDNQILGWIAWVVPFPEIIALLNAWLAAILVWYVSKKALRWAKLIQ